MFVYVVCTVQLHLHYYLFCVCFPLGPQGEHQALADPQTVHAAAVTIENGVEPASTVSLRERGTGSVKIETGKGTEWRETKLQTGTEIEKGIVGIPEPQSAPQSGEGAVNRGATEKSGMERVKESEVVGRNGSTKSAPVAESEKGSARKIRGPKEKEMNGVTRVSEKRKGIGRSVRASSRAKAGVERGGTKGSVQAGSVLDHILGVDRNQKRRAGSVSVATTRSIHTNAVTVENAVTAEMPAMGKTI